ncbi:hypothetical protein DUI87_29934 [Hirundo rustica rustica]|uniref:Uncharacterized protein n=1 Tax=Hirundo rustica rustica TaxID=333673 RepID=A0A3M0IXZ3_HIRRU|nr:hypothetical protein DUI87_29934 [Hirundo rustica rustica]
MGFLSPRKKTAALACRVLYLETPQRTPSLTVCLCVGFFGHALSEWFFQLFGNLLWLQAPVRTPVVTLPTRLDTCQRVRKGRRLEEWEGERAVAVGVDYSLEVENPDLAFLVPGLA